MKSNVLILTINVPSERSLQIINKTDALKRLFHTALKVGDNTYNCNHFNYSEIERMQCQLFQITSKQTKK